MALTVQYVNGQGFDATVIDRDDWIRQSEAIKGNLAAVAMVANQPQFVARAKTTDNTAASAVIDLTAQGVTFPAKTYRRIRFRSTAVNGTDSWVQEWEQTVYGNDGTTPKLLGSPRLLTARGQINGTVGEYGLVRASASYSTGTATANASVGTSGTTIGDMTSGVATITHPIARAGKRCVGLCASTDDQTNTTQRYPSVAPATSNVAMTYVQCAEGVTTSTGIASNFAANGFVDATLYILPPPSVQLAMATNNVTVTAGYDASDNVYHDLEVFISRADTHLLAPD